MRTPFQGTLNILRFNSHMYFVALAIFLALLILSFFVTGHLKLIAFASATLCGVTSLLSVICSYWAYDASPLYDLPWANKTNLNSARSIANFSAGFDEITPILKRKYPQSTIRSFDFYNEAIHTEISIKQARKLKPAGWDLKQTSTTSLPLPDNSQNSIVLFMAAHEIRDADERILFFQELKRICAHDGQIIVTEHLRDCNNFLAYSLGFMHFYSRKTWLDTFHKSELKLRFELKTTPFISTFILTQNGIAP